MTSNFIPAPYVDFSEMRRRVYSHLFPLPASDSELRSCIENAIGTAKTSVGPRQELPPRDGRLPINEYLKLIPSKEIIGRINRQTALATVDRLEKLMDVVVRDTFDEASHFPIWRQEYWLPKLLRDFLQSRADHYSKTARAALYQGTLLAYWSSSISGVQQFPNRFVWQDNNVAADALTKGIGRPFFGQQIGGKHEVQIIFDPGNLARVFPPFEDANEVPLETPPGKLGLAIEALQELYPEGIPKGLQLKQISWSVVDHLASQERYVSDRTVQRAVDWLRFR